MAGFWLMKLSFYQYIIIVYKELGYYVYVA